MRESPRIRENPSALLNLQVADGDQTVVEETLLRLREAIVDRFTLEMAEGHLREARGQLGQAVAAFERAAAVRPEEPGPLHALVRIQITQGRMEDAEAI